jgi:hypothetical protein
MGQSAEVNMHKLALRFGENVYAYGKHCGQLAKIVVTPKLWQITDLIVEDGLLFKQSTVRAHCRRQRHLWSEHQPERARGAGQNVTRNSGRPW